MRNDMPRKLIFIYNADSGLRNAILDSAHKIFRPETYDCKLCDITYGVFSENAVWKKFRTETVIPMEFLHKDEFAKAYKSKFGHKFTFPIVLAEGNGGLEVLVHTGELNLLQAAEELVELIEKRMR